MESLWERELSEVRFGTLEGNKKTEVLIIGGGIAGILCAYRLKNAGVDCVLVEKDRIGGGITGHTTAKITLGHGLIYDQLIRRFGVQSARLYLEAQMRANEEYAHLCQNLDCDYEKSDSYVYALHSRAKIEKEIAALESLGMKETLSDASELPFKVAGAVGIRDQAQLQPLKFLYAIAKDLPIYEHTKVLSVMPYKAITENGTVFYRKLIVATHFPMLNKHGLYPLKLYQHRSYVLALRGAQNLHGTYVDECDRGLSFRRYGDLLLLGGGGHRTGKKGSSFQELEAFARKHYPSAEKVGEWATQDCMTLDGMPYIGQYARSLPDVYVATGFNKWGMTNAMACADILTCLVCGKKNRFAELFSPQRRMLRPQLAVNILESAVGLLTPTVPRCPHLGCALKYNRAEHSWDCPCHGSRFCEDGTLIDNPATDDHHSIGQ
ncbi:MAG: FAD-dependent oxidoreductase [Clostridia bacterium]|nr:FAD-dependent oxidoreductase [Clostridia bacterium]